MSILVKICSKCGQHKSKDAFSSCKTGLYGVRGDCKLCRKSSNSAHYKTNLERRRAQNANYARNNRDKQSEWYYRNKGKISAYRKYYIQNNRGKINAISSARKNKKRKATPKWLSREDKLEMELLYTKAATLSETTGIKYHVDHIVPINGENISGLHVPWNLQILTAEENYRKSNKIL